MNANVMKTNNGKRLIAAVAVLAMVLCAFAIAMPASDAADPESEVTVIAPTGTMDVDFDGETAVFTGIAVGITEAMDSNKTWCEGGTFATCFTNAYDSKTPWGYSFVEIDGLNSLIPSEASNIVIEQKNSALKSGAAYGDEVDDSINQTTGVKTKTYTSETSAKYALLVPDDNSNVVITVYEYDEKATTNSNKGKVIDTITLNFSEVVYADESVTIGDKITFDTPVDGLYVAVNGTTVTYYGEAVGVTSTTDSNKTWCEGGTFATCFTNAYDNQTPWGYSFVEIDGLNSLIPSGDTKIIIQQTNSALKSGAAYGEQVDATINQANGVKTKEYDSTGSAKYALLVPKDSSNVTIAVYAYDENADDHIGKELAKYTLDFSNVGTVSEIDNLSDLETALSLNPNVVYTGTLSGDIDISKISEENQSITFNDVSAYGDATSGNEIKLSDKVSITVYQLNADKIVISIGSFHMYAENLSATKIDVTDYELTGTLGGDLTLSKGTGNGLAYVLEGGTLDLGGNTLTVDAGVILTARGTITNGEIVVNQGATFDYSELDGVTIDNKGGIVKVNGQQGIENIISVSQSVNGTYYLSGNTTILEGITLTVPRGATLDLMGYNLTVKGTLVVESRGTVTSGAQVNGDYGTIVLTKTGAIQNAGTIGDTMEITVANGANGETGNYTQTVDMQGISGVSFTLDRNSDKQYDMSVSGTISPVTGAETSKLTLNSVGIDKNMTIGKNIEFVANNVVVDNGVVFTHSGKSADFTGGFTLLNGASAVINAKATGKITVATGQVTNGKDPTGQYATSVTLGAASDTGYITGITISADRVNVPNEITGKTDVFQRMYVTGTLNVTANETTERNPVGTVALAGTVYVKDTLTVTENAMITFGAGSYFDVSANGNVIVNDRGSFAALDLNYNGARYVVETTSNNDTIETTYYTSFASAMAQIATAQNGVVYIAGAYEITGTYTVAEEQEIAYEPARYTGTSTDGIIVAENGQIDVDGGVVANAAFKLIEGRVIVSEGIGYKPAENQGIYAVVTVDAETYDTTYSGFKIALDNAASGQTITVVDDATYDGNMNVPEGVIVEVEQDNKLTVLGNVTVDGKLVLDDAATLAVGKDAKDYTVTVNGELDASEGGIIASNTGVIEGTAFTSNVDVYSTGTLSYSGLITTNANLAVNAAYYDDAGEVVYTSVAKAVAYAEENMIDSITALGKFTETGAITSDGVDIVIDGQVTLGSVTLNEAEVGVIATGEPATKKTGTWYTADVSGLFGTENATATVSVYQTQATVSSSVELDATGASDYTLSIDGFDNNVDIAAGTVDYTGSTIVTDRDNVLTVTTGATLLITGEVSIAGEYIVNEGTVQIDDEATLTIDRIDNTPDNNADNDFTNTALTGNIIVSEGATLDVPANMVLTITGTVSVDTEGDFTVDGTVLVGEAPELLGQTATGSVTGTISVTDAAAKVIVFNGGSVADAEFDYDGSTEVRSTAFSINGIAFATYYTFTTTSIDRAVNDYVYALKDLQTKEISASGAETDDDITIEWYAGETLVKNERIGDFAEVNTEIQYKSVGIQVSVGSHISIVVDNVVYSVSQPISLTIGTHTVSAVVDPGYSGDVVITFNGQAITGGSIEVTSEMLAQLNTVVLSATGNLTQDSTVVIDGGSSGDSGMGLTDYLLIILVILIVVMAIMVAMRLMRS